MPDRAESDLLKGGLEKEEGEVAEAGLEDGPRARSTSEMFLALPSRNSVLLRFARSAGPARFLRAATGMAVAFTGLGLLQEWSTIPAVAGFLGTSLLGAAYFAVSRRRLSAPVEEESDAERMMRLSSDLDATSSWVRDGAAATFLSLPPIIFWNTSLAYMTTFGMASAMGWAGATVLSAIPPILFAARAGASLLRRKALVAEIESEQAAARAIRISAPVSGEPDG